MASIVGMLSVEILDVGDTLYLILGTVFISTTGITNRRYVTCKLKDKPLLLLKPKFLYRQFINSKIQTSN